MPICVQFCSFVAVTELRPPPPPAAVVASASAQLGALLDAAVGVKGLYQATCTLAAATTAGSISDDASISDSAAATAAAAATTAAATAAVAQAQSQAWLSRPPRLDSDLLDLCTALCATAAGRLAFVNVLNSMRNGRVTKVRLFTKHRVNAIYRLLKPIYFP